MNNYERMKHVFMMELNKMGVKIDIINAATNALDRAAYPYEIVVKETALSTEVNPIPQLVKIYLVVKKTEGLSDGTLENYMRILTTFFLQVKKSPQDIEAADIRMFIYAYKQMHNISDRTLDKYRQMICWFFQWAHSEEYIQKNPAKSIKAIKHEIKERVALTQIELEYLRMACKTSREKAILEFMYSTGCRVSELIAVKLSDINWQEREVHLFGKGKKHRTSYLNAKCVVTLKEYLKTRNDECDFLFVTERRPYRSLSKEATEKIIRLLSEKSSITKRVTPHILRHTTATQAVNNGMAIEDVSKLLGHANVNTTLIYAKTSKEKVQNEHKRCVV